MYQCSLHFNSVTDICRFIKTAGLKNFLLLGKKSVLVARYTDKAMQLAKEMFQAEVVSDPELSQLSVIYFNKPVSFPD
jgi:hypothetical protein